MADHPSSSRHPERDRSPKRSRSASPSRDITRILFTQSLDHQTSTSSNLPDTTQSERELQERQNNDNPNQLQERFKNLLAEQEKHHPISKERLKIYEQEFQEQANESERKEYIEFLEKQVEIDQTLGDLLLIKVLSQKSGADSLSNPEHKRSDEIFHARMAVLDLLKQKIEHESNDRPKKETFLVWNGAIDEYCRCHETDLYVYNAIAKDMKHCCEANKQNVLDLDHYVRYKGSNRIVYDTINSINDALYTPQERERMMAQERERIIAQQREQILAREGERMTDFEREQIMAWGREQITASGREQTTASEMKISGPRESEIAAFGAANEKMKQLIAQKREEQLMKIDPERKKQLIAQAQERSEQLRIAQERQIQEERDQNRERYRNLNTHQLQEHYLGLNDQERRNFSRNLNFPQRVDLYRLLDSQQRIEFSRSLSFLQQQEILGEINGYITDYVI